MSRIVDAITSVNRRFEDLRCEYEAARDTRFRSKPKNIHSAGSGADYHYRNEHQFYYLIELGRELRRDDPIVGQGINTFLANVIQDGFVPEPQTGDPEIDAQLKDRWATWAADPMLCDAEWHRTFHDFETLATDALIVDGDIIANPLQSGHLQWFEAHRMRSPLQQSNRKNANDIIHGVEKDRVGRRLRYWITKQDYDGFRFNFSLNDLQPFQAYDRDAFTQTLEKNIFHVYFPSRFSQTRGVTKLAPATIIAGMHKDLQYATLVKSQVAACVTLFRMLPQGTEVALESDDWKDLLGDEEQDPCDPLETRRVFGLAPGAVLQSRVPGETLEAFTPQVPTAEFFNHSRMLLTFIAVNLDIPLILLLMDGSETNFSGWRGAMDQAKLKFRMFQRKLAEGFHTPVYRWKLRQWLATSPDLKRAFDVIGPRLFAHDWHYPRWPYIEPAKDAAADLMQMRNGLNSPRRILRKNGLDHATIVAEAREDVFLEIQTAMDRALELNKHALIQQFPEQRVDWREVARMPLAEGFQVGIEAAPEPEPEPAPTPQRQPSEQGVPA